MAPASSTVTVILPVFNRERIVGRAVESALRQTYKADEIIVVDDGSTDGTSAVLETFGNQLIVLRQPNRGPYPARNLALRHAHGDYIAFLDSDDAWLPEKLEKQVSLLDSRPEVGLVFGNAELLNERQGSPPDFLAAFFETETPFRGWVFPALVDSNFISQSSVVVRRKCLDETGPFLELPLAADYHKWLQVSLKYQVDYLDDILFQYYLHEGNISRKRLNKYQALNMLFKDLVATNRDPEAGKILQQRLLRSEYELALAELEQSARRMLGRTGPGETALNRFTRLKCFGQVVWHKSRSFIRSKRR